MKILTLFSASLLLAGCQALSDYDRTLSLIGNVNTQSGALEYHIRPASSKGAGRLGGSVRIEGTLAEGKRIIALER